MKKMFVAFGIAFALVCGIGIIGRFAIASAEETTNPVTIEEAVTSYIAEDHPNDTVENVYIHRIEKDDNYGGWRVDASYELNGEYGYISISRGVLGEIEF